MTNRERALLHLGIEYGEGYPLSPATVRHVMRRLAITSGHVITVNLRTRMVFANGRCLGSIASVAAAAKSER